MSSETGAACSPAETVASALRISRGKSGRRAAAPAPKPPWGIHNLPGSPNFKFSAVTSIAEVTAWLSFVGGSLAQRALLRCCAAWPPAACARAPAQGTPHLLRTPRGCAAPRAACAAAPPGTCAARQCAAPPPKSAAAPPARQPQPCRRRRRRRRSQRRRRSLRRRRRHSQRCERLSCRRRGVSLTPPHCCCETKA